MSANCVRLQDVHWVYFYRWAKGKPLNDVGRIIGTHGTNVANIVRRSDGRNVLDGHLDAIAKAKGEELLDQLSAFVRIGAELEQDPSVVDRLVTEARETRYGRGRPRIAKELPSGSAGRYTPALAKAIERRRGKATESASERRPKAAKTDASSEDAHRDPQHR